MRYATNKETSKRYCLDCKRYDCNCLPEGKDRFGCDLSTRLKVVELEYLHKSPNTRIHLYKQILPNGRIIKNSIIDVPFTKWGHSSIGRDAFILLSNNIINKSFY